MLKEEAPATRKCISISAESDGKISTANMPLKRIAGSHDLFMQRRMPAFHPLTIGGAHRLQFVMRKPAV